MQRPSFFSKAGQTAEFAVRQAGFFWDIIMLKIRIIGFANKRSDPFTSLGKTVYLSNGSHDRDGEKESLIAGIKDSEREIRDAEAAIVEVTGRAREDRRVYYSRVFGGEG